MLADRDTNTRMEKSMCPYERKLVDDFHSIYESLVAESDNDKITMDDRGRIYDEWLAHGKPDNIKEFILWRANTVDTDEGFPC